MKDINKEALFNEVKGSLFEFLVGKEISKYHSQEFSYLKSLSPDYARVLQDQDRMTRLYYPELREFLEKSSVLMANDIIKKFPDFNVVKLVGKASHSGETEQAEADLILGNLSTDEEIFLSLKISKKNSYINSKSAGAKSFIKNYFPISESEKFQNDFNQFYQMQFEEMARDLHIIEDLVFDPHFKNWREHEKTELPGELGFESSTRLIKFYYTIALKVEELLREVSTLNKDVFLNGLKAVTGFSQQQVVQAHLYHESHNVDKIQTEIIFFNLWDDIGNEIKFRPTTAGSVEIQTPVMLIQLRVKPMNKFTSPSVKINCSYKLIKPQL